MKGEKIASLVFAIFLVLVATTLVLPNRATPKIVTMFFEALTSSIRAVMGTEKSVARNRGSDDRPIAV